VTKSHLVGGPCVGGPLAGTKRLAYGGPVMPCIDKSGKKVGVYVWDEETGFWEFDSYSTGETDSPYSLYEGDDE